MNLNAESGVDGHAITSCSVDTSISRGGEQKSESKSERNDDGAHNWRNQRADTSRPQQDDSRNQSALCTNILPGRFQRSRWSFERDAIAAMLPGETLTFPAYAYNTVKSAAQRLSDAFYGVKEWKVTRRGLDVTVSHFLLLEGAA